MAGPGTARRPDTARRRSTGGDALVAHYMQLYPGMTADEAREYAETMRAQDAARRRTQ